jgi:hypothetical protein
MTPGCRSSPRETTLIRAALGDVDVTGVAR